MPTFHEHLRETSPFKVIPHHHRIIAEQVERLASGEIENLMILMPVQHGKSFCVSDRLPSYVLGRSPKQHVLLTAYGNPLVQRAIVANRNTMRGEYWQQTYGWPVGDKDTQNALLLDVPGQDGRFSLVGAPLNGSIAGHTVDLAIVDDICRNEKDALSPTVRTTVSDNFFSVIAPRAKKIILVTTPWHLSDISQENIRLARNNPAARQWVLVVLAATNDEGKDSYIEDTRTGSKQYLEPYDSLWPEVWSRPRLEEIKASIRERKWQALYMCRPSVGSNCLFPRDKWGTLGHHAPIQINWAWDFASGKSGAKNDFTVGCCVGLMNSGRYAVLDLFRGKPDFTMMKQLVFQKWLETYQRYRLMAQVFIEDASAGQQILQEIANVNMRQDTMVRPIAVAPTLNKEMRAEAIASAQNNGQVDLPENVAWAEDFITELEQFPLGEHDDCVDGYTWAQAGFVRGEGFFKKPKPEELAAMQLTDGRRVLRDMVEDAMCEEVMNEDYGHLTF
ncbi:MAG TPA: phage terminase large subunit [Candidatus Sulfotelmatobacter sp.]|nr:phage terminase large subunit [Candidatus Sulfotelmatobacter sp.]